MAPARRPFAPSSSTTRCHWMHEYHVDGLRLDATHALVDDGPTHVRARAGARRSTPRARRDRSCFAEDHRNLAHDGRERRCEGVGPGRRLGRRLPSLDPPDAGRRRARVLRGYRRNAPRSSPRSSGRAGCTSGRCSRDHRAPRGTDPSHVPMRASIVCLQNHDQIGNRAFGDRLHHSVGRRPPGAPRSRCC